MNHASDYNPGRSSFCHPLPVSAMQKSAHTPPIRYRVDEATHIATLTLNRPEAANAYSQEMIDALVETLHQANQDPHVRVLILTGEGRVFSAGGDLQLMRTRQGMFYGDPAELRQSYLDGIQRVPRAFAQFRKPVIAAINGAAIGAGLDLACMCDIRIASNRAKFGSTFIQLGLVPGDGGAHFLAKIVGFPKALELILTGRVFGALEANDLGLLHDLVEPDAVMPKALDLAKMIAAHPPEAVSLARTLVYKSWNLGVYESLDLAATYQGIAQNRPEHDTLVAQMIERTSKNARTAGASSE